MPIYRLEVTTANVSRTSDPGYTAREFQAAYVLNAFDGSGGHGLLGAWNGFGIAVALYQEASGAGIFCQAVPLMADPGFGGNGWVSPEGPLGWVRVPLPYTGSYASSGFYGSQSSLSDASWFTGGGTTAVEKDTVGQTIAFISPAGTITIPWSQFILPDLGNPLLSIDNSNWAEAEIVGALGMSLGSPASNVTSIDWSDLFFKTGGVTTGGHHLSTADPGVWGTASEEDFQIDVFTGGTGFPSPLTRTQLGAAYRTSITGAVGGFGPTTGPGTFWYLPQRFSGTMGQVTAAEKAMDHGVMWRAAAKPGAPTALVVARSFDGGHSWTEYTAYNSVGTNNSSPSLNWCWGRLYLTWYNGTNAVTAFSTDGGVNWSMPVIISGVGANPVHLIDKDSGLGWYFYTDGADLKVRRSADGGHTFLDPGSIVVQTGIGAQTVGASFTPDRGLAVSYFDASNLNAWTVLKSRNLGATWS